MEYFILIVMSQEMIKMRLLYTLIKFLKAFQVQFSKVICTLLGFKDIKVNLEKHFVGIA